jgi:hypothetical protein
MRTHREPARVKEHHTEEEHTPTVREGAPRERGRHSAQRSVHSDDDDMVAECWVNLQQSSVFPTHNDLTAVTCSQVSHDLFLSLSPAITSAAASARQLRQPLSTNFASCAPCACGSAGKKCLQVSHKGLMRILVQNCSFRVTATSSLAVLVKAEGRWE